MPGKLKLSPYAHKIITSEKGDLVAVICEEGLPYADQLVTSWEMLEALKLIGSYLDEKGYFKPETPLSKISFEFIRILIAKAEGRKQ